MAEGLSVAAANAVLGTLAATYTWVQKHVGPPGPNGTANVAVDASRVQATWSTPSAGAITNTGALVWSGVAGSEDYTHATVWTASVAGTFGFSGVVTANAVTAGDTFTIPIGELDAAFPTAS